LGDASKRDAARQQALAKIAELRAEYAKKIGGLKVGAIAYHRRAGAQIGRTQEAGRRSCHRAVEIIRSDELTGG